MSAVSQEQLKSGHAVMSELGQKRRFPPLPVTSGLPRSTDIIRPARHVSKVPNADMSGRREVAHKDKWLFRPAD
jgi:hypothetical protein